MRGNIIVVDWPTPKLQAEVDFPKINKLSADDILHEAGTLDDRWPSLPGEDRRKIMECLVEKIVIGDGEIDITLSQMPSSESKSRSCGRRRRAPLETPEISQNIRYKELKPAKRINYLIFLTCREG